MAQVEATTERVIAAGAETVFDTLADYAGTRARLLPEQFSEYRVDEGGDGEGTVVHWKLQATSKRVRDCLLDVTEPTDGQLVEKDRNSSMVTTWTVTPAGRAAPGSSSPPSGTAPAASAASSSAPSPPRAWPASTTRSSPTWRPRPRSGNPSGARPSFTGSGGPSARPVRVTRVRGGRSAGPAAPRTPCADGPPPPPGHPAAGPSRSPSAPDAPLDPAACGRRTMAPRTRAARRGEQVPWVGSR